MSIDWIEYRVTRMRDWEHNEHAAEMFAEEVIEGHDPHKAIMIVPTTRTGGVGIDDHIVVKISKNDDEDNDWITYQVKCMEDWPENEHAAKICAKETINGFEPHMCHVLVPTEVTNVLAIDDLIFIKFQKI